MLCEECGKNEATVHIQAMLPDGTTSTRSLCQPCMNKLRAMPGIHALDISEFLGALFERIRQSRQEKDSDSSTLLTNTLRGYSIMAQAKAGCPAFA